MSETLIFSFLAFALVSSITPGPNNVMLMASGANFGLRATAPHLAGVNVGFMLMVFLVGLGLVGVFAVFPHLYDIVRVAGAIYLLHLGSGLIVYSQKMTVAAMQMADMKVWAHRS